MADIDFELQNTLSENIEFNLDVTYLGDSYVNVVRNKIKHTWQLDSGFLLHSEVAAIETTLLNSFGVNALSWQPFPEIALDYYRCTSWNTQTVTPHKTVLSCTLVKQ